jgi:hypothetical protein
LSLNKNDIIDIAADIVENIKQKKYEKKKAKA